MRFKVIGVRGGKVETLHLESPSKEVLEQKLKTMQIAVIEISELGGYPSGKRGKSLFFEEEIALCFKQMAMLLDSFMPLDEILGYLKEVQSEKMARLLEAVLGELRRGKSLSESFKAFGSTLSILHQTLILVGEKSGKLQEVFAIIAQDMQERLTYKKQVKKALFYPIIVFISLIFAFVLGVIFIIPEFKEFFSENALHLPLITRSLLFLEDFLTHFGWLILVMLVCGVVLFRVMRARSVKFKNTIDLVLLKIPLIGKVLLYGKNHKFLEALYFLQTCGNDFKNSLVVSAKIFDNFILEQEILSVLKALERGESFSTALHHTSAFDAITLGLLQSGEKSGRLDSMFLAASKYYKEKSEDLLGKILLYIEPLCSLLMASMVLYLALGIFLPIWSLQGGQMGF